MADATGTSTYVKLTKDQDAPMEDILPGELNQPIRVPQLEIKKCIECGQTPPESYKPPADETWSTGLCGCAEDIESCWTGLFCPCVLFGHNVETLKEDIPWTSTCAVLLLLKVELHWEFLQQRSMDSPCDPCMVHCCMHWCAICQEHREMKGRLSDNVDLWESIVNPPPT